MINLKNRVIIRICLPIAINSLISKALTMNKKTSFHKFLLKRSTRLKNKSVMEIGLKTNKRVKSSSRL